MTGTWATDWATGDIVTAAEFRKSIGCINDSVLGSSAASFDFTGLPITYAHLVIELDARCDGVSEPYDVTIAFNGDTTGGHYATQKVDATATTVTASVDTTSAYGPCSLLAGAGSTSLRSTKTRIVIPNYSAGSSLHRGWHAIGGYYAAAGHLRMATGVWLSAAAISRVTIGNSIGNFITGSRCSIYVLGS